jgi:hypothetical protein
MAVGVPENDVFAAADTVLARGERPTVERVRLELGRGSPARVGALLDQWWEQLAGRLRGETRCEHDLRCASCPRLYQTQLGGGRGFADQTSLLDP